MSRPPIDPSSAPDPAGAPQEPQPERGADQATARGFDASTLGVMPDRWFTRVVLVRHGAVAELTERVVRGQLDTGLSALGRAQSRAAVDALAARHPDLRAIFASDLPRCAVLAEALAERTGAPLAFESALREQHMGRWQGRTWSQITAEDPERVSAYWDDYANTAPPEGESLAAVQQRVRGWWSAESELRRGGTIAIVGHVGTFRCLLAELFGTPLDQALRWAPGTGSLTELLWSEAGAVLEVFGERPAAESGGAPIEGRARLALSGSAGTGKTSLGQRVAESLGVPFIEEGMRRRLEAGLNPFELGPGGYERLMEELWREQAAAEDAATSGFVADRSAFDFAAVWLHYAHLDDPAQTEAWMRARLKDGRERYDRVLLLPWGAIPLEHDGVRSTDRWVQFRFQSIVEDLLRREARPGQVVRVPGEFDLEARRAFALESLAP
ncbi:MAG: histidine phosphatase family protein, partial [Planctomycetota bacterium]|jgi:alpha-ribazole phosphatase/probable phosphoglycerate mutase